MIPTKTIDKHSDKRKAILNASLKLFCEKCFQDTSTASISQQANVATGTLFLYFENKETLVNELYLESKDEYASYVEEGVWENQSFKTQLKHIFDRITEWKMNNEDKVKFMGQFCSSSYITKLTREKAMTRLSFLNDVVKKAVANKEVSPESEELMSAMLSAYFHSASTFLVEKKGHKNFKKWKDEAFEYIWHGIH